MHVTVTGRNIDLTPALKDYLTEKLKRAQNHIDHPLDVSVCLKVAKNPSIPDSQTAEVTLKVNGTVIRGQESTENMYASIDLVADKIERQLRKYKTRYSAKSYKDRLPEEGNGDESEFDEYEGYDEALEQIPKSNGRATATQTRPKIVRSKRFPLKPMMPDEAASHMDLLGHDFFMFINSESGQVNTVYHRRDGNYGLIEPED